MSNNNQVGGNHYQDLNYQPVDFIEDLGLGFMLGSAIKYLCRFDKKGGNEDLLKAIDYLERFKGRGGEFPLKEPAIFFEPTTKFISQFSGFKYSVICEILCRRIDSAIAMIKAEVEDGLNEVQQIKDLLHYPECWDTINFPTLLDAMREVEDGCTNDHCPHKKN